MSLFGLLALLVFLIFANYWLVRSILYPPFLFCGIWLFILTLYAMHLTTVDPLHAITFNVVGAGAVLYSIGGGFALGIPDWFLRIRLAWSESSALHSTAGRKLSLAAGKLDYAILGLVCLGILLQVHQLAELASQSIGGGFMARAQRAGTIITNDEHTVNFLGFVMPLSIYAATMLTLERGRLIRRIAIALAFISCLASGGRGGLLILLSALTCAKILQTGKDRFYAGVKIVRWVAAGFVLLFAVLMVVEKDTSNVQSSMVSFAINAVFQYLVGPVAGLDYVLTNATSYVGLPHHTFKLFLKMAAGAGLISYTPPPQLDAFVYIPFGTNVYTIYKPFITDFGLPAAVAIMSIIGFLHTALFRFSRSGNRIGRYLFCLTIYPILMVFFDDVYTAFALYLDGLFFGLVYLAITDWVRWLPLPEQPS